MIETHLRVVLHVLLDDLINVLHPLGRGLRRVGERLPAAVHLEQGALERGGGARRFAGATAAWPLRRKFLYLGRAVGRHVGAEGGRGQQGALLLLLLDRHQRRGGGRGQD